MKSRWYPLPFNFIICIVTISFICRLYRLYVGLLVFVDFFVSCLTTLWVLGWGFGDLREGGYLYIYREKIPPCSLGTRESLAENRKGPKPIYTSPQRARRRGGVVSLLVLNSRTEPARAQAWGRVRVRVCPIHRMPPQSRFQPWLQ